MANRPTRRKVMSCIADIHTFLHLLNYVLKKFYCNTMLVYNIIYMYCHKKNDMYFVMLYIYIIWNCMGRILNIFLGGWEFLKIKYIIISDWRVTPRNLRSSICVHKNKDSISYLIMLIRILEIIVYNIIFRFLCVGRGW